MKVSCNSGIFCGWFHFRVSANCVKGSIMRDDLAIGYSLPIDVKRILV